MNRPASIGLILLAAASGFAAGWMPRESDATEAGRPSRPPRHAPAGMVRTSEGEEPPALPELNTVEACREFLRTAAKQHAARHPFTRQAIRDYALRRWLELDAESALQEAERQPGHEYAETGFAPELFRVWLDLNVDSAIEGWTQANPLLASNVRISFLTALADKDPARAYDLWKTPRGKSPHEFYDPAEEIILQRWAQTDPAGALAKSDGDVVWGAWIDADPAAALTEMRQRKAANTIDWPPPPTTAARLMPWLLAHSPGEAAELLAAMTAQQDDGGRGMASFAQAWLEKDAAGAVQWALAQAAPTELALEVTAKAAREMATSDPLQAIELLKRFESSAPAERLEKFQQFDRAFALREVFASLAATDAAKAHELLAADPELAKNGGVAGYLTHAFADDTDAAIAQTREWLRDPALKEAAADGALMAFRWQHGAGARDPSALLAAIPELAGRVDADVLSGWAKVNPAGAADFIMERVRGGHEIADLHDEGVFAELAISQPARTADWLQQLPDATLQAQAAKALAANWSAFDPEAAAAWINSLPQGPLRAAATGAIP